MTRLDSCSVTGGACGSDVPAIEVRGLSFTYPGAEAPVLDGLDWSVPQGAFALLVGGTGSGKSTLAKHLNALLVPDKGQVEVCGMDTSERQHTYAIRQSAGMVFQNPDDQLVASIVEDDVAFGPENLGVPTAELRQRVTQRLEDVGLSGFEKHETHALSGGQKQRVAIARALANDPQVLLCDEATSALDPQTTKAILHLLKHLNETLGITIVLITHEMAVVKEICDRVAVMEYGRVVEQGEVFTVFAEPKQDITKSFIHTTSNLQKVEELIAEDSPVTRLQPGELIVRLSYIQRNVNEPIISAVSQMFNVSLNIIFADITIVQDSPIGGTVAIISGERKQITKAIEYLIEKNVGVEVIKDARTDR